MMGRNKHPMDPMDASKHHVPGLNTKQLAYTEHGGELEEAPSTTRNTAAQCQASLVVKMPLLERRQDDAESLLAKGPVAEEVVHLYYTRLLEDTIGARPAGPALDLAMSSLGLTSSNVQAQTKVVGGTLQVAGSAPATPQLPAVLPPEQVALVQSLGPLISQQQQQGSPGNTAHSELQDEFDSLLRRHTYPYSCQRQLSKACPAAQAAAAALAHHTAMQHKPSSPSSSRDTSCGVAGKTGRAACCCTCSACRHPGHQIGELSAELWQELSQELQVTPASVAAAQQRFHSSMVSSLTQHHSRALASWGVGPEELQAVGQLLQSEPVLKLGLTLMYYLYTRSFIESSFLPAELVQHLRAQGGSRTKCMQAAKRRSTLLPACTAADSAPTAAAAGDTDQLDRWDLGIALLLQGKAHEAAEQLRQHAAAAAAAASAASRQHMRLPQCIAAKQQQQQRLGVAASPASDGSRTPVSYTTSSSMRRSGAGALLQHQESGCSSRSRSSYVGSVASYQQQCEAAQHQAQLLSSAPIGELQSCRMWGMLRWWEELRELLSQSDHGAVLALPVVLLSLATLVEHTFGSHFPAWARSSSGVHMMQELAAAPAQLFDPQCCYRTLTVLAGSPAAIAVRQQHDVGPFSAVRKRGMHHAVSSAVAASIGAQPGSTGSRKMLLAAAGRKDRQQQAGMVQRQQQQAMATTAAAAVVHTAAAQKLRQLAIRR